MRDFLGVGGYGVGAEMNVRVIRDGVQIGDAGPLTLAADAELNGFGEVNHPGGICWNGVTPDIVAGDVIQAVDADGNGHFTVVQNVEVTQPATVVDADGDGDIDDVIARGMASNVNGTGRIDQSLVEQRIINPDLKDTAIDRRDVRAIFGDGLADGVETRGKLTWDDPAPGSTDPHWTATYLNMVEPHRDPDTGALTGETSGSLAKAGQSRMLAWERTNANGDRIGMTLWEYGELGGPGFGGCPASQTYAVAGASPRSINTLTSGQANLTLSGTATNVDTVTVSVDDHDAATPAATATATVARPVNMTDTTVPMPGNTTWNATLPMSGLLALNDDTLVATATYGRVTETTTDQDTDGLPETPPVPVTTRTSNPIGGSTLNILKDLTAPAKPTAFPGVENATIRSTGPATVTATPDNEIEDVVRYRIYDRNAATKADPTSASSIIPVPFTVSSSATLKLRSYDPAGNPSQVATFDYIIGANVAPDAPAIGAVTAGNGSATVRWTPPGDNGGAAITNYVVRTLQGGAFLRDDTVPGDTTSAVISGLTNGSAYTFQVAAVNSVGRGAFSPASSPETTPTGPANVAPAVSAQTPAANATGVPVATDVTATFSEAVNGVSGTTFTLRAAGAAANVGATVTRNGTTNQWILNPTADLAAGTQYTATLTGGTAAIRDLEGAPLATRTWTFTTASANAAPTITGRGPAVNATAASVSGNVTVTFSEAVNGVSGTTFTLRAAGAASNVGAVVTQNGTTNQWILNPNANLVADTRYTVSLTGGATAIRDLAGAPFASTTWSFTTGPAPTITGRGPATNATAASVTGNVTVTFSEAVNGVTGTTFTLRAAGAASNVGAVVSRNGTTNQWILNPNANLAADTRYTVSLTGGATAIRDLAGNPFASTTWSFTTGPAPTVSARTPGSGATGVSRTANVTATFSEAVQGISGTTVTLRNPAGTLITAVVSYSTTTRVATLNPSVTLAANTVYRVNLVGGTTAIRDAAGNPLANTTWTFTTGG